MIVNDVDIILMNDFGVGSPTAPLIPTGKLGLYYRRGFLAIKDSVGQEIPIGPTYMVGPVEIDGQYDESILIEGDATITDGTVVNGSLVVTGSLINATGKPLTVNGNLIVRNGFMFTPTDPSAVQGNVIVLGDMFITEQVIVTSANSDIVDSWDDTDDGQYVIQSAFDFNTLGFPTNFNITFTSGANIGTTIGVAINTFYEDRNHNPFNGDGFHLIIFSDSPGTPHPITNGDRFTASFATVSDCKFNVNAGQSPSLMVGGDLVISPQNALGSVTGANLDGSGKPGAQGLIVQVGNDFVGQINLNGGPDTATLRGGSGGLLGIGGNYSGPVFENTVIGGAIFLIGGSSSNAGQSSGPGGALLVGGSVIGTDNMPIDASGGFANDPSIGAGDGGVVSIAGDAINCGIHVNGGSSQSTLSTFTGAAGTISIKGDYIQGPSEGIQTTMEANGGSMFNNLNVPASTALTCGAGGNINIYGNVVTGFGDGDSDGAGIKAGGGGLGNISSTNSGVTVACGHGGTINLFGDLTAFSGLIVHGGGSGGTNIGGNAADGGTITIYGHCNGRNIFNEGGSEPFDPELIASGGSMAFISDQANLVGNGGTITVSSCEGMIVYSQGGNYLNVPSNINGPVNAGNGGIFYISGGKAGALVNLDGGSTVNNSVTFGANAGNAGIINAKWDLELIYSNFTNFSSLQGGNVSGFGNAGHGGAINCGNDLKFGWTLNLAGPPTINDNKLLINGGSSTNGHGGEAGVITCWGNIEGNQLVANGGNAAGAGFSAGSGAAVYGNKININVVKMKGGNSALNVPGSGGRLLASAGLTIGVSLDLTDGTGVGAATNLAALLLAGQCDIGSLSMTSRSGNRIAQNVTNVGDSTAQAHAPTTLRLNSITGKTTLDTQGGTPTASISAMTADSIFTYDIASDKWYRHQGTQI